MLEILRKVLFRPAMTPRGAIGRPAARRAKLLSAQRLDGSRAEELVPEQTLFMSVVMANSRPQSPVSQ